MTEANSASMSLTVFDHDLLPVSNVHAVGSRRAQSRVETQIRQKRA